MSLFTPVVAALDEALTAGLPWPQGDAEGVAAAARQTQAIADRVRSAATALSAQTAGSTGWTGTAAGAFHSAVAQERNGMDRSAGSLEQAGGALRHLSQVITEAQHKVLGLAREVHDAEEAARAAAGRATALGAASFAADTLLTLAGPSPAHGLRSDAQVAHDASARAQASAGSAQAYAEEVRRRATQQAQTACDDVRGEDTATAGAVDQAAGAAPFGGSSAPAAAATPAQTFATTEFSGLSGFQWQQLTYFEAGITHWDPAQGLLANDHNVQAVYTFYGRTFLENPNLQWAGMANLVGPLFYAGWQDLYTARNVADPGDRTGYLNQMLGLPKLPGPLQDGVESVLSPFGAVGAIGGDELGWYERRFLTMQKKIFDDLAWKHTAYSLGGIDLMRQLRANGQLQPRELQPFEDIASGDPTRIADGNQALLYREQHYIIQPDYNAMRTHDGPVGPAMTEALTWTANNPIPGGHSYAHDFHHDAHIPVSVVPGVPFLPFGPHVDVPVPVSVPTGNIADYNDRWRWISQDMLPAYRHLLQDPGQMQALVNQPVAARARKYRLTPLPYPGG